MPPRLPHFLMTAVRFPNKKVGLQVQVLEGSAKLFLHVLRPFLPLQRVIGKLARCDLQNRLPFRREVRFQVVGGQDGNRPPQPEVRIGTAAHKVRGVG